MIQMRSQVADHWSLNIAIAVPPALLITTQLLMGLLYGTLGLFVASPLLTIVMLLVNKLYVERLAPNPG